MTLPPVGMVNSDDDGSTGRYPTRPRRRDALASAAPRANGDVRAACLDRAGILCLNSRSGRAGRCAGGHADRHEPGVRTLLAISRVQRLSVHRQRPRSPRTAWGLVSSVVFGTAQWLREGGANPYYQARMETSAEWQHLHLRTLWKNGFGNCSKSLNKFPLIFLCANIF